jgi:hypothetical protein
VFNNCNLQFKTPSVVTHRWDNMLILCCLTFQYSYLLYCDLELHHLEFMLYEPSSYIFISQLNTCGYSPYVTSSLTRVWVCRLQLLLGLASAVILRSESRGTHDHILLTHVRDSPNLSGQVPVFICPRNRVTRLYPRTLGSLFFASYDSQG